MYFNLEVHLCIEGTRMLSKGRYAARRNSEIPLLAYQVVRSIKRETGYRTTLIEKVIVNGTEDISEEVKKIESMPIPPLDNIFW
ncbi:hypothetical protein P5G62_005840 [Neobacillus sp. 179-C4.2 HS]|uniref:Uncharacterized protein n=1 Tax=Neobacillus driksii TaxID=3035913 RepID=A0ABV4YP50_9BACI|nr:hypothetical protein [Neobacillus sp. 179.-C4.2 HS]MDP5197125.1 hypothetical protein [Neobacillus sp. 179.-C4.2 HS]